MGHGRQGRAFGDTDIADFSVLKADWACVIPELHFFRGEWQQILSKRAVFIRPIRANPCPI